MQLRTLRAVGPKINSDSQLRETRYDSDLRNKSDLDFGLSQETER